MPGAAGPILITGATGFIGRALTRRLLRDGTRLALVTRPSAARAVAAEVGPAATVHAAALEDADALRHVVGLVRPEVIYHLAALTDPARDVRNVDVALMTNLRATIALAEAVLGVGVRVFVAAGTAEEYGRSDVPMHEDMPLRPLSPYSAAKAAASLWLKMMHDTFGLPAVVLRPFLCYGPGQAPPRLVPSAILHAIAGRDFPMTEGLQLRELTYVDDVVDGFVRAAATPAALGEAINLGSGVEHTVIDIVTEIYRRAGRGGRPLPGALPTRSNEMRRFAADGSKAARLLGWRATTPLGDGLDRTIRWAEAEGDRPVPFVLHRARGGCA